MMPTPYPTAPTTYIPSCVAFKHKNNVVDKCNGYSETCCQLNAEYCKWRSTRQCRKSGGSSCCYQYTETNRPTAEPTVPTMFPTLDTTLPPTVYPTHHPTWDPTESPTANPTDDHPTFHPSYDHPTFHP